MHYVYLITNLVNWKTYVGITTNPKLRWAKHRWAKHRNGVGSRLVRMAIAKYGIVNFRFDTIFESPNRGCVEWMERQAIAELKTESPFGYNRNPGGGGSPVGIKQSDETIVRRAAANRGKKRTAAFGLRMRAINRGRIHSDQSRKRMSAAHLGHQSSAKQRDTLRQLRSKPVLVDGIQYGSIKLASESLGIRRNALTKRFRRYAESNSFPTGWAYLS